MPSESFDPVSDEPADAVEHASPLDFTGTLLLMKQTIVAAGLVLFCEIDHAAGALAVGLEMPPAVVLVYGHPRAGTPAMTAAPLAALDLPLRLLVRQDPGGLTLISFHPVGPMLQKTGVPNAIAKTMEPAQSL